ncbi:MAG: hypothetical protein RLZZ214_160 [Verrucomicrobiota bacterium]|jgi:hypothetical protein
MTTRRLLLGLLLSATALAEEIPRAVQVTEPPAPLKLDGQDRVISRTKQFRVTGGEPPDRATISQLAEEAKDELLRLTEERDAWKVPVSIELHGKSGDPMPPRTVAMRILVSEVGYDLRLDVHLSRGIEHERFKFATTSALIYERALRDHAPKESDTPYRVPPWLVDGLREATAWRLNQSDRRLYEALFKTGGLFKIDDVFAVTDAGFEEMDAAMRAAFRVSSGALVMALLQQPQGKEGFRAFLTDVASYEGETPSLLRKHFPELNLSETSLDKWWRLQMADIGARNLATDILTIAKTETSLADALRLNFRTPEGITEQKDLTAWPELAALPEPERIKAVQPAQDALVRLSIRCFPSYRPILGEYQIALSAIAKNKTKDVPNQLTALAERRATMTAKAQRAGDYLDWFEITRARETSGAFDDYMRLKDRLKANPHRRTDDLSKYLDRMDAIFTRKGDPASPLPSSSDFPGIPELPKP